MAGPSPWPRPPGIIGQSAQQGHIHGAAQGLDGGGLPSSRSCSTPGGIRKWRQSSATAQGRGGLKAWAPSPARQGGLGEGADDRTSHAGRSIAEDQVQTAPEPRRASALSRVTSLPEFSCPGSSWAWTMGPKRLSLWCHTPQSRSGNRMAWSGQSTTQALQPSQCPGSTVKVPSARSMAPKAQTSSQTPQRVQTEDRSPPDGERAARSAQLSCDQMKIGIIPGRRSPFWARWARPP